MSEYLLTKGELYHHGILGQKWGKQNGPPYPLGSGGHSKSEQKAGWRKSLGGGRNEELYDRNEKSVNKKNKEIKKEDLNNYRQKAIKHYSKSNPGLARRYKEASDEWVEQDLRKKEQLRKALLTTAAVVGVGTAAYIIYKYNVLDKASKSDIPIPELMKESLHDMDFILNQGDELHRIVGFSGFDVNKVENGIFAATNKADADTYKAFLANFTGKNRYDVTLEAAKDIVAPGRDEAKKIFDNLWNHDKKYRLELQDEVEEFWKSAIKRQAPNMDPMILKLLARQYARKDIQTGSFDAAIAAFGNGKTISNNKFVNELKKYGFNALMDYHDIDAKFTKTPIIVLDKSALVKKGEQVVNTSDKIQAVKDMVANKAVALTNPQVANAARMVINNPALAKVMGII